MYGDPDAIRALARTLTDQGEAVRTEGRRLLALLGATRWTGRGFWRLWPTNTATCAAATASLPPGSTAPA